MRIAVDICVVGGGPAGAMAAIELCKLGYKVCVVERQGEARPPVGEALPETALRLLAKVGVLSSIVRRGLLPCNRTQVNWGVVGSKQPTSLFLVDRGRFDVALLMGAHNAGAILLTSARARRPSHDNGQWMVMADTKEGSTAITARFLVDATGRRGAQLRLGPKTTALCGRWRGVSLSEEPEMLVAAGDSSWLWTAPLPDGSHAVTSFVDTQKCIGLDRVARRKLYCALIDVDCVGRMLDRAGLIGEIKVRDATFQIAADLVTPQSIKAGDSALAMDPLSSQGVQAALRAGLQASIVANTILTNGDIDTAMAFYRQAVLSAALRHRRTCGEIYSSQTFSNAFWRDRSTRPSPPQPRIDRFMALRPNTCIRLSPAAALKELPCIDGAAIRRKSTLCHPSLERAITWFAGVEIAPLLMQIGTGCTIGSLMTNWSRVVPLEIAQGVLNWLADKEIVVRDLS